jgi:7-carboxy-7-deazaguanine synthase
MTMDAITTGPRSSGVVPAAPRTPGVGPTLVLSEVFGPTIQGEGPSMGRRASFVRLGGCNLKCSWCDTAYTWDAHRFDLKQELRRHSVSEVLDVVGAHGTTLTVLTGGEPLLHQRQAGWLRLLDGLSESPREVEVETNGTRPPSDATTERVARFTVSPKLAHAGMPAVQRIDPEVMRAFVATGKASFKFVARVPGDLDEAGELAQRCGIPASSIWIMPEGVTPADVHSRSLALIDAVLRRGYNFSTRLHVLLWSDERRR